MRVSRRLLLAGAVSAALLAGSGTLVSSAAVAPHGTPGVTATQVSVGAIVTQSGPLAADFKPYLDGVDAYFDYVNAGGGVNGRKVVLTNALDDESSSSQDINDAETLVTADHVFAIVGVSVPFFTAYKYLETQAKSTPVFGYATGNVWAGPKEFFADYGSVLNYNSSIPFFAYVAKQTKSTKVAIISLSYASSQDECKGAITGIKKYGYKVVYSNPNESILQNWSEEADNIYGSHAQLLISCMDDGSDVSLAKALSADGYSPAQLWLDGYDRSLLQANEAYMQGVYLLLQHVPFEAATLYPSTFPGLVLYLDKMQEYGFSSNQYNDVALMGWESANLFVEGLRAAGKNPTQAEVIADINKIKADTGGPDGGVTSPVNWTTAHKSDSPPACETFVRAQGTNFDLAFNSGSKVWVCFPFTKANLSKPVAPPKGAPGG